MPEEVEHWYPIHYYIVIGALSLVGASYLTCCGLRKFKMRDLLALHEMEDGAAYTLSYVMVMPIYIMFICLAVECILIFITYLGAAHAAYAACRSNIVYHSLDKQESETTERSRRVAVRAMVPFATSFPRYIDSSENSKSLQDAQRYVTASNRFITEIPLNEAYLRQKYRYADQATKVTVSQRKKGVENWNQLITVHLTYEAPLLIPGVTRFLGRKSPRSGSFFVAILHTEASLPDERPQSPDGKLGVTYPAKD